MPGAFLDVFGCCRQPLMHMPAFIQRHLGVQRGPQKRMGEPQDLTVALDEPASTAWSITAQDSSSPQAARISRSRGSEEAATSWPTRRTRASAGARVAARDH